ncbi:MAG TPA: hypothetical protein VFU07_01100 [Candidatus Lumbricidophila sp.]|nr:hypothetical protein [Candidatus Lumbricidophila sp.]
MRWDLLFDDLEARLEFEHEEQSRALAFESERLRVNRTHLRDRILQFGQGDAVVQLVLPGETRLGLTIDAHGRDWVSGRTGGSRGDEVIVRLDSIAAVIPSAAQLELGGAQPSDAPGRLAERISLPMVLRDLGRRRQPVRVLTIDGAFHGTFDRVGADHADLALHDAGTARRQQAVTGYRVLPLSRVIAVIFGGVG